MSANNKVFRTENQTYKFEAKEKTYVTVKDRNCTGNNLVFTNKKRLKDFINKLEKAAKKL